VHVRDLQQQLDPGQAGSRSQPIPCADSLLLSKVTPHAPVYASTELSLSNREVTMLLFSLSDPKLHIYQTSSYYAQ
jgi:hypothetical protein